MHANLAKPAWALLAGASFWGIVWYPYRLLAQAGLDGIWSTSITYAIATVVGGAIFFRHWRGMLASPWLLAAMGLSIGWSNLAYVLAVLEGEVMRVLLLFYLAPLWTVPLAWLLLDERLDRRGFLAMVLAFAGAATMLWRPELGFPWPESRADWLAGIAGFLFALGNVLVRKVDTVSDAGKSIAIWLGVTLAAVAHIPWSDATLAEAVAVTQWPLATSIGVVLVAMSLAMQYGLSRLPANRAIVILLFELPVAVVAAWLLADEVPRAKDYLGGLFIVAATLVTTLRPRISPPAAQTPRP